MRGKKRAMMRVAYLSGGVGGARLADGLARALPPEALALVVNVGDDFEHWGLSICPDLDTVMYTLAGLADEGRGWGLRDESYAALAMVARYGGPAWFALGDRDLATHLLRSARLRAGKRLTEATRELASALGVRATLLPATDAPYPTRIVTENEGELSFQEWLVQRRGKPPVAAVRSAGEARASDEVHAALGRAELVIIGPSNPYVSIDPILGLPAIRDHLRATRTVAVSPIVAGKAIKGPLAQMIPTLSGEPAGAGAIARHYGELLDGFVHERGDEHTLGRLPSGCAARPASTVMRTRDDRLRLAEEVLSFARTLGT